LIKSGDYVPHQHRSHKAHIEKIKVLRGAMTDYLQRHSHLPTEGSGLFKESTTSRSSTVNQRSFSRMWQGKAIYSTISGCVPYGIFTIT
jgi:hypothetical protein